MGLVDFVRDAGQMLFRGAEVDAAAPAASPEVQSKRAHALEESVQKLGLPAEHLKIKVAGDTAHVRAKVPTQEVREKLVLANKPMLKDPDRIYPGQVLRIPKA